MQESQVSQVSEVPEEMQTDMSSSLGVVDYSDKSFVVCGELTRRYKETLKTMGGRFNKNLTHNGKNLVGWIFPLKNKEKVMNFVISVNSGNVEEQSDISSIPSTDDIGLPTIEVPKDASDSNTSSYSFVRFKIYRPKEGQKVRLNTGGKMVHGVVTKVESHNRDGVMDTVYIDFDGKTSMGVICRSKWQIFGYFADHSVFFTD